MKRRRPILAARPVTNHNCSDSRTELCWCGEPWLLLLVIRAPPLHHTYMPNLQKFLTLTVFVFATAASQVYSQADKNWWSLQKIERPELPEIVSKKWPRNAIDHFILEKLEKSAERHHRLVLHNS